MSKIAIVTDSTAYLPAELREKYQITVTSQVLLWDGEALKDGVDIQPEAFYRRLQTAKNMPTTSQVAMPDMQQAFSSLLDQGYEVLGLFLSSKLSGTFQSAMQGRSELTKGQEKVKIIDSQTTTMALGLQVLTLARAAAEGASLSDCCDLAETLRERSGVYFVVDTLEFLHRGGRIGGAQRLLGTALNLKPILTVQDGKVEAVERVRTKSKALDRLIELVAEKTHGQTPLRVASLHANAEAEARETLTRFGQLTHPVESLSCSLSPVVGTHTGPGTIGLAYLTGF
jgi:DegV family protein with EDD domain